MNDFQSKCINKCKDVIRDIQFVEIIGKSETYYKADINHNNQFLEIYVYNDEAGVMIDKENWTIFEKPDYDSPDELIKSFIEHLTKIFQS
jgi:hypothetical protein